MKNNFYKLRKYIIEKLGGVINSPLFENSNFQFNYSYLPFEKFVVTKSVSNLVYNQNPVHFYNSMQEMLTFELSQELSKSGYFKMYMVDNTSYDSKDFTMEVYIGKPS